MIQTKYIVTFITLIIGLAYLNNNTRQALKSVFSHEYVEWRDFNRMLERQRLLGKV